MSNFRTILALAITVIFPTGTAFAQVPLTTAFTYQGQLRQGGSPASGVFDMRFRLYDALAGGALQGSAVCVNNVSVVEGLFTLPLDFGAQFAGQRRFLEIEVRPDSGADCTVSTGFTLLAPRQELAAVPYAQFALGASGSGVTNLNAANITTGSLAVTRMPTSGFWNLSSSLMIDSSTFMVDPIANRVGMGTEAPAAGLHVIRSWDGEDGAMRVEGDKATIRFSSGLPGGNQSWMLHVGSDGPGNLGFYRRTGPAAWVPVMSLTTAGTVGIGVNDTNSRPLWTRTGIIYPARLESTHNLATAVEISNTPANAVWEYGVAGPGAPFGLPSGSMYLFKQGQTQPAMAAHPDGRVKMTNGLGNPAGRLGIYTDGTAFVGISTTNDGVFGSGPQRGVYSSGDFVATGTKAFQIDHPLDPENKYLQHYCSESPEPQNIYNGIVTLDALGEARVDLPGYFAELNRDSRYSLTPIGAAMPNLHIQRKIVGNAFHIAGGAPGMEVSWQVTAVRNDQWVRQRGAPVEVEKPQRERGKYLHPELFGKPPELKILPE